jgi:hypothetical protein
MPNEQQIRKWADSAWLIFIARATAAFGGVIAALMVPAIVGAYMFLWDTNANQAVQANELSRHTRQIEANTQAITTIRAQVATRDDMDRMEGRIMEAISELREDRRADRRNPQ